MNRSSNDLDGTTIGVVNRSGHRGRRVDVEAGDARRDTGEAPPACVRLKTIVGRSEATLVREGTESGFEVPIAFEDDTRLDNSPASNEHTMWGHSPASIER